MVFCPYGVALRPSVGRSFPFLLLALTNKKEEKEGKIKTPKKKRKKKTSVERGGSVLHAKPRRFSSHAAQPTGALTCPLICWQQRRLIRR